LRNCTKRSGARIDSKSLELITQTIGEWQKLGREDGKYKNPKTGEYTMVSVMECASCGAKIPRPEMSGMKEEERFRILKDYQCPKCGGPASALGRVVP